MIVPNGTAVVTPKILVANGEEITVNDGNTFIQIAPKDSAKIS